MKVRKILVPLTGTDAGESALATAWLAADTFAAHLSALHVRLDSRDVAPLAGDGLSGAMIESMMTAAEGEAIRREAAVRALFLRFADAHGVPVSPEEGRGAWASFDSATGREEEVVTHLARLADLTVVPHPEAGEDVSSSDALHAVLFDSGRGVVIAPMHAPATLGRRVCLGWNGSAESAAATVAAMPWLERAEAVRVLWSPEYQRQGPAAAALVDYLSLHGVRADTAQFKSVSREVGAGLLAAASAFGADLLVMGAYSHSRLRQLILGGVTRHVLENAPLPVLMSR